MIETISAVWDTLGWGLPVFVGIGLIGAWLIVRAVKRAISKVIAWIATPTVMAILPSWVTLQEKFGDKAEKAGMGLFEYISKIYGG